jgi:choice-of-anchor A domain-containing protein
MSIRFIAAAKLIGAAIVLGATATPASATLITDPRAALGEWNLITLGDHSSSSHVDGRVFVGGNETSSNTVYYGKQGSSSAGTANLTVVGNLNGYTQNTGGVSVGKSMDTAIGLNGPNQSVKVGGTAPTPQNLNQNTFEQNLGTTTASTFYKGLSDQKSYLEYGMNALSSVLDGMSATATYSRTGDAQNGVGNFIGDGTGINVIDLTSAQIGDFKTLNVSTAGTLVINVSGTNIDWIGKSFSNGTGLGTKVIWNFYEATTINFTNNQFYGTILAPKATASMTSMTIDGSAVFKSLNQGNNEIHLPSSNAGFDPTKLGTVIVPAMAVPEPATWAMMIAGFGLVGSAMRRRRPLLAA